MTTRSKIAAIFAAALAGAFLQSAWDHGWGWLAVAEVILAIVGVVLAWTHLSAA